MADRYLLESGAPDGYLLENGSGVLLLESAGPNTSGNIVAAANPVLRRRDISNLTWLRSPAVTPNNTTEIPRAPVIIRREVRYWPIPPQSVNLLVTTLAPVVAAPFVPIAWPVPRGYSRVQYGFTQAGLVVAPVVPPVFENPRGRAFDTSLRTWLQSLVTTTLAPADVPFAPIAFPNPVLRAKGVDGLTWARSPAVPVADNPPAQSTTPNPVLRAWSPANLTWTQSPRPVESDATTVLRAPLFAPRIVAKSVQGHTQRSIIDATPAADPQVQSAQDLPVRRKWDANLYTWLQSPAVPAPSATPFVQSTTQNPVLRKWGALTWTQSPAVQQTDTTNAPAFAGWENPIVGRVRIENRTWIQTVRDFTPAPSPFTPVDFANPVLRKPDVSARTWTQSPAVPDSPFVQSTTPNPILRKERFDLRTWLQSLSLPSNVDVGSPFVQSNGPNPVRVPRNVAQSGMVLSPYPWSIPPAPVVPDTSATGGWWRPVYKRRRRDVPVEVTAPAIEAVREAVAVVAAAPVAPTKAQRQAVKAAEALFAEEMRQQWQDAYAYELRQLWAEELQRLLEIAQRDAEDDEIAALLLLSA